MELILQICLGHALLGLLMFEWAWFKTTRLRVDNSERDKRFPAFKRRDKQWRKWRYYPGALLFLPAKGIAIILTLAITSIVVNLLCLGQNINRGQDPLKGWRKKLLFKFFQYFTTPIFNMLWGFRKKYQQKNFDYTYYLGPDYKQKQVLPPHNSCYVCAGHTSTIDNFITFSQYGNQNVLAKESLRKEFVVGRALEAMGTLFIERSGSEEAREQLVQTIIKRQLANETSDDPTPDLIYADSTTSNNAYFIPMKRGAFAGLRPLTPVILHFEYNDISPAIDMNHFLP